MFGEGVASKVFKLHGCWELWRTRIFNIGACEKRLVGGSKGILSASFVCNCGVLVIELSIPTHQRTW